MPSTSLGFIVSFALTICSIYAGTEQANKNQIQNLLVVFLAEGMQPGTNTSVDGIITSVDLKPAGGGPPISLTIADDGKTVKDFTLHVLGPNRWRITNADGKLTPFIEMVTAKGFFQEPGDKRILLGDTLQPKGGPKLFKTGVVTGKIMVPQVAITHPSRGNDRVVSAKDEAKGMRGGTKVIHIDTKGATVDLTIERMVGQTGSATFAEKSTARKGVFDITIKGGEISDRARNMAVMATISAGKDKGNMVGCLTLTVFRVDQEIIDAKDIRDIPGFDAAVSAEEGEKLTDIYKADANTGGNTALGVQVAKNRMGSFVYGGIVFRAKILPDGVAAADFNRIHDRFTAFNWDRRLSGRKYTGDGCLARRGDDIHLNASDDISDNLQDADKDLLPDADDPRRPNQLYMWALDAPSIVQDDIVQVGKNTASIRYQFSKQQVFYDRAPCSNTLEWFFRATIKSKDGGIELTKVISPNDNQVKGGSTELTWDLNKSKIKFTVTKVSPLVFNVGDRTQVKVKPFTITGTTLNVGKICEDLVYAAKESDTPTETKLIIFPVALRQRPSIEITKVEAKEMTGTFAYLTGTLGAKYQVKVFIADQARTAPQTITVAP